MIRAGLITTIRTNPGDDLIRIGILRLLAAHYRGREIEPVLVNKHLPATAYPRWHPAQLVSVARRIPRLGGRAAGAVLDGAARLGHSRFGTCDLIVQCGAPVVFPRCHAVEFSRPGWRGVVAPLADRIPVLNLAAGSCYPWEAQPQRIPDPRDAAFVARILDLCRLTTVRDRLAADLCAALDRPVVFLPCTALLAGPPAPPPADGPEILVSYMTGAGHYAWDQRIDDAAWAGTVRDLLARLRRRHRVAFLAHDEAEVELARRLVPALPRHRPRCIEEYARIAAGAKVGLVNRMHAGVMLAGMGIPSVAVGTDSRLLMVKALGLPCHYVKDVTADLLLEEIEGLLTRREDERERLTALRGETTGRYLEAIAGALP